MKKNSLKKLWGLFSSGFSNGGLLTAISLPLAISLISCGDVEILSKIDGFRTKKLFFKESKSDRDKLIESEFKLAVFGNYPQPYFNINNFYVTNTNLLDKDFADYLRDMFVKVAPQRLNYFYKNLSSERIADFTRSLEESESEFVSAIKDATTIILNFGLRDLFDELKAFFLKEDYLEYLVNGFEGFNLKNKVDQLFDAIDKGLIKIKKTYKGLVAKLKALNPKADILLLGFAFVQQQYVDKLIFDILKRFFKISDIRLLFDRTLTKLNSTIKNLASETDLSYLTFNDKDFFEIKEPLLDSTYSIFSLKLVRAAQEKLAKFIFLKLSAPDNLFLNLPLLLQKERDNLSIEEARERNNRVKELRIDWLEWLGARDLNEEDFGHFYKFFYFNQEQLERVRRFVLPDLFLDEDLPEDNYKKTAFYIYHFRQIVESFFDQATSTSFLEDSSDWVELVANELARFFAFTFEEHKNNLKWVDLVKIVEIITSFYNNLATRFEAIGTVEGIFKTFWERFKEDLKGGLSNLNSGIFRKYKQFLIELLDLLVENHQELESLVIKYLLIELEPKTILNFLNKIKNTLDGKA